MKCIGYGEHEGKCSNKAGTKWSKYWCERCNHIRLDTISAQMQAIGDNWPQPTKVKGE